MTYWRHPDYGLGIDLSIGKRGYVTFFFPQIGERKTVKVVGSDVDFTYQPLPETNERHREFHQLVRKSKKAIERPSWSDTSQVKPFRSTHCYLCKKQIDSDTSFHCDDCDWLICPIDGACGCSWWGT